MAIIGIAGTATTCAIAAFTAFGAIITGLSVAFASAAGNLTSPAGLYSGRRLDCM
jgi:hypothetical protein